MADSTDDSTAVVLRELTRPSVSQPLNGDAPPAEGAGVAADASPATTKQSRPLEIVESAAERPSNAAGCVLRSSAAASFEWSDLSVTVDLPKGEQRTLLRQVSGIVMPGELCAIMGPSGAGKSTLLEALSGRITHGLEGTRTLSGRRLTSAFRRQSAFVMQDDALIGAMTVFENIYYSALLRLPSRAPRAQLVDCVNELINELGLRRVADSKVGNALIRGISGGERRRCAIANELVTRPSLIFLDEPTSGLDSTASFAVISRIQRMARDQKRTVIATIHQPATEVFELFDRLMLIAAGETAYFGMRAEAPDHFARIGFPCPAYSNPADFFIKLVNVDFMENAEEGRAQVRAICDSYKRSEMHSSTYDSIVNLRRDAEALSPTHGAGAPGEAQPREDSREHARFTNSFIWQARILTQRGLLNAIRNPAMYWIRVAMYVVMALLMGTVWLNVGYSETGIQDRFSALFFSIAFLSFMSVAAIPAFLEDRLVFYRERNAAAYGILAYVLANSLVSLPFVLLIAFSFSAIAYPLIWLHPGWGHFWAFLLFLFLSLLVAESMTTMISAIVPIFVAALAVASFANGFFMVLEGFFVAKKAIPDYWIWGNYISYQKYGFEALVYNDFPGLTFDCSVVGSNNGTNVCSCAFVSTTGNPCTMSGMDILTSYEYQNVNMWAWFGVLVAMVIIFRMGFYFALWMRKGRR